MNITQNFSNFFFNSYEPTICDCQPIIDELIWKQNLVFPCIIIYVLLSQGTFKPKKENKVLNFIY